MEAQGLSCGVWVGQVRRVPQVCSHGIVGGCRCKFGDVEDLVPSSFFVVEFGAKQVSLVVQARSQGRL
jgi:hypothetical protein